MTDYPRDVDDHPVMCVHHGKGLAFTDGIARCAACMEPLATYFEFRNVLGERRVFVTPFGRDMGDETPETDGSLDQSDAAWLGYVKYMRDRGHYATAQEDMGDETR